MKIPIECRIYLDEIYLRNTRGLATVVGINGKDKIMRNLYVKLE